ncbi:uncharacterized protein LOC132724202 [Ruditapes philippinarum]|uniref:uncharacterized protein LOC132724202 n=1 Tax=Ruditapes philippinarum TaxID=129788 RepID=UPI00295AFC0A|nr:uncharacterized protein LOC132724202 [Ruditapes philippinarum]
MEEILVKCGFGTYQIRLFREQKITPDIVPLLSLYDFKCLGVTERYEIMKLRVECVTFGRHINKPVQRGFKIPKITIESLLESGFSIVNISQLLGVSESTIYRNMRRHGISKYAFTSIEDHQLDVVMAKILEEFPRCGEMMLRNLLGEKGIKIQRFRVRDALKRLDSDGVQERKRKRLKRRVYCVQGPNELWHIDTNHKLIRWNFIICGGVDGFSRFITFLVCTENNKATTILDCFTSGVQEYGTPLRVRSDMGMENSKVMEYMNNVRGTNSMLTGKSTHNQRIERLWRDVFDGVLSYYYDLFYFLEDENLLDVLNEKHLYALHHVYLSSINKRLHLWRSTWNSHRIRTVKSSPLKLFTAGMLNNPPAEPALDIGIRQINDSDSEVDSPDEYHMSRPLVRFPNLNLSEECLSQLDEECPQDWTSDNHGIDVLMKATTILSRF